MRKARNYSPFQFSKTQKKMLKTSKTKNLRDVVMLLHLLVRKIKKHKFGQFFAKKCDEKVKRLYLLHTRSKKSIIYQNVQHKNPHPILTAIGRFAIF